MNKKILIVEDNPASLEILEGSQRCAGKSSQVELRIVTKRLTEKGGCSV